MIEDSPQSIILDNILQNCHSGMQVREKKLWAKSLENTEWHILGNLPLCLQCMELFMPNHFIGKFGLFFLVLDKLFGGTVLLVPAQEQPLYPSSLHLAQHPAANCIQVAKGGPGAHEPSAPAQNSRWCLEPKANASSSLMKMSKVPTLFHGFLSY